MSKADTDYLEKRLIQDFQEKSDYEMMNSTAGNTSYIDKLQKAKSDQLYDTWKLSRVAMCCVML